MKRNRRCLPATLLVIAFNAIVLCACSDDENKTNDGGLIEEPNSPTTENALSPDEQKQRLEEVGKELISLVPASDFKDIADLGNYIDDTYGDRYNWDAVDKWARDAFNAVKTFVNSTTEEDRWGDLTRYTNYKAILLASNFTGHFTAGPDKWVYSAADDLQFIFTDAQNGQCVAKLETSGSVKKVHLFDVEDWTGYDYSGNQYTEFVDRTACTIGVPEKIVVTLTQGNTTVVKSVSNINLASLSGEEFDLSKNSFTANTVTELSNGYSVNVSQVAYSSNEKASASCSVSKSNTTLVSMSAAGDISGIPSVNVSAFSQSSFDIDDYNTDNSTAKDCYVKMDVLGKVQMQGKISDLHKYADYLDEADLNDNNESLFKSNVDNANNLSDIYLFYDNSSTYQAEVKMAAFPDETWNGVRYWEFEPVIYFFDGSSYSSFSAFFNERDFKTLINLYESLEDDYDRLIND